MYNTISIFNIKLRGNYPEANHKQTNNNILHIKKPLSEIAAELKIPSYVSPDETFGRLRRRYGFTIQDARDAITSLLEKK